MANNELSLESLLNKGAPFVELMNTYGKRVGRKRPISRRNYLRLPEGIKALPSDGALEHGLAGVAGVAALQKYPTNRRVFLTTASLVVGKMLLGGSGPKKARAQESVLTPDNIIFYRCTPYNQYTNPWNAFDLGTGTIINNLLAQYLKPNFFNRAGIDEKVLREENEIIHIDPSTGHRRAETDFYASILGDVPDKVTGWNFFSLPKDDSFMALVKGEWYVVHLIDQTDKPVSIAPYKVNSMLQTLFNGIPTNIFPFNYENKPGRIEDYVLMEFADCKKFFRYSDFSVMTFDPDMIKQASILYNFLLENPDANVGSINTDGFPELVVILNGEIWHYDPFGGRRNMTEFYSNSDGVVPTEIAGYKGTQPIGPNGNKDNVIFMRGANERWYTLNPDRSVVDVTQEF